MKNTKEIVDEYLIKNRESIKNLKEAGIISWRQVALDISNVNKLKNFISTEYIRKRFLQLQKKFNTDLPKSQSKQIIEKSSDKFVFSSGKEDKLSGTKEFVFTADRIPTEQEIVEHFNIDTTKFRISQIWHKTTPSGKYSISVNLQALKGAESVDYQKAFQTFLDKYNGTILSPSKKEQKTKPQEDLLYLVTLGDLHIGNYQKPGYIESIKNRVFECFNAVKDTTVEKIVILNTGDMIHTDTSKSQTWNNTQLDSQDSYEDAFVNALDLVSSLIDYASNLSLSVTYVNVRGNHSFDTEYCMGEALKRIYKSNRDIEIINSKDTRIYYKWKNQGFLFTHGDRGVERLPLMFATEGKKVFANTDDHHIILGHLHHSKGKQFINDRGEFAGIEVRVVGSPTSNDIWHKQNAFCQNKKSLVSFIYSTSLGKYGEFNFKI